MRLRTHQPRRPVAFAVLAGLVAAACLAAIGSASATASDPAQPVQAITPAVTGVLSVFARQATAADTPSAGTIQVSDLNGLASLGFAPAAQANPALARLAFVTPQDASIYLIPTQDGACLVDSSGVISAACATTAQIAAGEALASTTCSPTLPSGDIEIAGIVPDGAQQPLVVLSDGATEDLSVENNAFVLRQARSAPLPTTVEWTTSTGSVSTPAPLPADTAAEPCVSAPPS
jgi:hypothetical protein